MVNLLSLSRLNLLCVAGFLIVSMLLIVKPGLGYGYKEVEDALNQGGVKVLSSKRSPLPNIHEIITEHGVLYLIRNQKYAIRGEMVDLFSGEVIPIKNLEEKREIKDNIKSFESQEEGLSDKEIASFLANIKDDYIVEFPAVGKPKEVVTVFASLGCPACKRLFENVDPLTNAGYTLRFIYFPKVRHYPLSESELSRVLSGKQGASLSSVLCSVNKKDKLREVVLEGVSLPPNSHCQTLVGSNLELAFGFLQLTATPAMIASNGKVLVGVGRNVVESFDEAFQRKGKHD